MFNQVEVVNKQGDSIFPNLGFELSSVSSNVQNNL